MQENDCKYNIINVDFDGFYFNVLLTLLIAKLINTLQNALLTSNYSFLEGHFAF